MTPLLKYHSGGSRRVRQWGVLLVLVVAQLSLAQFAAAQSASEEPTGVELTAEEMKAVDYLVEDWERQYRVTAVDQAMDAVGLPATEATRFRIGTYLRDNPEVHVTVRTWGWETLVLTPSEKLVARLIVTAERKEVDFPPIAELADVIGITEAEVHASLGMLERWGILKKDYTVIDAGYRASGSAYLNWEPRLTFLFHTVRRSDGNAFNIFCASDFMLLALKELRGEHLTIEDSSLLDGRPIRMEIDRGRLVELDPPTTVIFLGGG